MEKSCGITPFLTFSGCAQEAIDCYISIFPNSIIESIEYFQKGERGVEGKVKHGTFKLMNNLFMALDMDDSECVTHNWSISFYINCAEETEFDNILNKLAEGGKILMGPVAIFNSRKAAWVTDKFGITWQPVWE